MRTVAYDFRSFVADGQLVKTNKRRFLPSAARDIFDPVKVFCIGAGVVVAGQTVNAIHAIKEHAMDSDVVAVMAGGPHPATSIDHAFDPVISMLQQMSFPVATIVIAWACLRAMTGHPAQAVDQAKWAILGYLAMRYAPEILRHI